MDGDPRQTHRQPAHKSQGLKRIRLASFIDLCEQGTFVLQDSSFVLLSGIPTAAPAELPHLVWQMNSGPGKFTVEVKKSDEL